MRRDERTTEVAQLPVESPLFFESWFVSIFGNILEGSDGCLEIDGVALVGVG